MTTTRTSKLFLATASLFATALLAGTTFAGGSIVWHDIILNRVSEIEVDEVRQEIVRDAATGGVQRILTVERDADRSSSLLLACCSGKPVYLEIDGRLLALRLLDSSRQDRGRWGERETFTFVVEREMKESGEKGGTEDLNIGIGELQEAAFQGDANLDGTFDSTDF